MLKDFQSRWKEWNGVQKASVLHFFAFISATAIVLIAGPVDNASRSIRRALGGESFIVYECSRAQLGYAREEAAKNLGVRSDEVFDFCKFYTDKVRHS